MLNIIKTALCSAVFLHSTLVYADSPDDEIFQCQVLDNYVQLSITRSESSGTLLLTTATHSTSSVTMQGGVASYGFDSQQFPIKAIDEKTNQVWVIEADCSVDHLE